LPSGRSYDAVMDVGGWLRGLGLDRYEAAFRENDDALGIESDDFVNYCFPNEWPADRERSARHIGGKDGSAYLA
jgi:hypothetical protein